MNEIDELSDIIAGWPPNIAMIRAVLPVSPRNIFAYDGKIYAPEGGPLPPELIAHEQVHFRQQGNDVAGWWDRFLTDPEFRLDQEMEAHRIEWQVFLASKPSRRERRFRLKQMGKRLSAPMYGRIITANQAMKAISK
jgi:hypothetical protein